MAEQMVIDWVAEAVAHSGLSQRDLSLQIQKRLRRNADHSIVNKMLKGQRDVSAQDMLAIEEITGHPAPTEFFTRMTRVPLISWVSAGKLTEPHSQIPVEESKMLAFADLGAGDFFALQVEGDSMNRVSPHGSIIVVNRADHVLLANRCYVFMERGKTTYKRWQPDPARLEPWSTNDTHESTFIKGRRQFEVVGRVRRTVLDL